MNKTGTHPSKYEEKKSFFYRYMHVVCTEGKPGVSDVFYFHTGSATLSTAIQFTLSMYNVVSYLEWKLSKNSFWIDFKPFFSISLCSWKFDGKTWAIILVENNSYYY